MASNGPQIIRPIPRRPFDLNLTSATPPDSSSSNCPSPDPSRLNASGHSSQQQSSTPGTETPSSFGRSKSLLNLTSSTLLGIYSSSGFSYDRDETETPWGTGAETPARIGADGDIMLGQDHGVRLVEATKALASTSQSSLSSPSFPSTTSSLVLRSSLLFAIGMGYGVLVTHLHNDQKLAPFHVEGIIKPSYDWAYLVFWGIAGVALGTLLPFVDMIWEEKQQSSEFVGGVRDRQNSVADGTKSSTTESGLAADWNPVVRSIGAFVGIAFAIRKLPWTSTLQVSLTLALVNPVLWYLVDRSKTGILLSLTVGVLGAGALLGLNPEMMPSPALPNSGINATSDAYNQGASVLGQWISQETVACGIWILSVLFCSCVCFGNIGRRLSLTQRREIVIHAKTR